MDNKDQTNKIIVVENPATAKTNHLTWKGYGKGIKHFKYWILGISLGCAILGYIGGKFILNPGRETLTTNIEADLALNEDRTAYLDGKSFFYSNIISRDNIAGTIQENEKFANYNADKLLKDASFNITPKTTNGTESKTSFTITCKPSAFKSTTECKEFLKDLLNFEVKKAETATSSFAYSSKLPSSIDTLASMEFDDIISSCQNQYDYLSSCYQDMEDTFNSYFVADDKTLNAHYIDFQTKFESLKWSQLKGDFYINKYVNISSLKECQTKIGIYKNLKATYEVELKTLQNNISKDKALLESLCNIQQPDNTISAKIISLSNEISSYETTKQKMLLKLADIGYDIKETQGGFLFNETYDTDENTYIYKLSNANQNYVDSCISFKSSLNKVYQALVEATDKATILYQACNKNSDNNNIYVLDANMGTISGHISNFLIAGVLLVVGFLLSSFIFAEIDINRNGTKKEENSKDTEEIKAKN